MNNPKPKQTRSGKQAASHEEEEVCETGHLTMQQLIIELDKQRQYLKDDLSTMINDSIRPVQLSVDSLKEQVQDFTVRLTHTEALAGENFEKLTQAEGTIKSLEARNKILFERVDDLENRSRRSNLQIINIPEGSERGRDPVEFMSELLKECMGPDVFPRPPVLGESPPYTGWISLRAPAVTSEDLYGVFPLLPGEGEGSALGSGA
uniref:Uncharacterized protein n=1 Tax=Knipowitschia caucasica TaxID=637954 RepID=A0AAV2MDU3_KNICA